MRATDRFILERLRRRAAALPEGENVRVFTTAQERNAINRGAEELIELAKRDPAVEAQLTAALQEWEKTRR